jgi:hypothetical protein
MEGSPMIEWANQNSGFIMAVLTFVYALATIIIVLVTMRANKISLASQKLQEKLEAQRIRPFISVAFELVWDDQNSAHTYIAVKNCGLTMAEDISIQIDPVPFYTPIVNGKKIRRVPFMLTNPIQTLAPGQEVSDSLGYAANLFKSFEKPIFKGSVTYQNQTEDIFNDRFVIDWESMKDSVPLRRGSSKF